MTSDEAPAGASFRFRRARSWYDPLVPLPVHLLETLVCPRCKQPLLYFPRGEANEREDDAFLLCPASRLRFGVEGGVANFILDEAAALAPAEVDRLIARARQLGLAPS
jgi:uncharacterized protein YbaR (Trm112 family)